MGIRTGDFAYCFPSIELLKDFIKTNKQILYPEALISLYGRYKNICFVFNQLGNGRVDWNAHRIGAINVPTIKYMEQRTE